MRMLCLTYLVNPIWPCKDFLPSVRIPNILTLVHISFYTQTLLHMLSTTIFFFDLQAKPYEGSLSTIYIRLPPAMIDVRYNARTGLNSDSWILQTKGATYSQHWLVTMSFGAGSSPFTCCAIWPAAFAVIRGPLDLAFRSALFCNIMFERTLSVPNVYLND